RWPPATRWYRPRPSRLTLRLLFSAYQGRARAASDVGHFIAEKVLRPVLDLAELVQTQRFNLGARLATAAEIHRHIGRGERALGHAALDTVEKVLRMALDDQLGMARLAVFTDLYGVDEHIGKLRLH